jgi:hypothetical protein
MTMARIDQHNNVDDLPMEQALVELADELAEFVSINAFMVSSMALLITSGEEANHEVINGARYCADITQERALKIKKIMNLILNKYRKGGRALKAED